MAHEGLISVVDAFPLIAAPSNRRDELADHTEAAAVSFEEFYRAEVDWARRLSFLLTADREAAEDIAQDAFMAISTRFAGLRTPRAYLRVTIVNASRKHGRRRSRVPLTARPDDAMSASVGSSLELLDAIDRLPPRQRAVLVLRYFDDLTEREIATALHCRPGTVKSLASRALATLRKEIDDALDA
jgi:RNA polymerase sigma factor (sigma-70 family)